MHQIAYLSTATAGLSSDRMRDILRVSRANNFRAGLTGLLLYDGYHFLQALEGDRQRVMAAYERIKVDPRHRALVLLSSCSIEARAFGGWAMAARQVDVAAGHSVADMVDQLTESVTDASMRALFRGFARVRQAA